MKNQQLSILCLMAITLFILSACSTVRVAKVEKRRYQNGYYVQMQHKPNKGTERIEVRDKENRTVESADKITVRSGDAPQEKLPEAIKSNSRSKPIRESKYLNTALSSLDDLADKVATIGTNRNMTSVSNTELTRNIIIDRDEKKGGTLGVLLLLMAISFLVLFLLVSWTLIVVIAVAVIVGIVLSIILQAVGLIGD